MQCPGKAQRTAKNANLVEQSGVQGIIHRHDARVGVSAGGRQAGVPGLLDVHNVDLRGCCGAWGWCNVTCTVPEVWEMQPGAACVALVREKVLGVPGWRSTSRALISVGSPHCSNGDGSIFSVRGYCTMPAGWQYCLDSGIYTVS